MNNSDKALVITSVLMVTFIVITFFFVWWGRTVPDSLIYCVLGSGTTELGICGWIYTVKKKPKKERTNKNTAIG